MDINRFETEYNFRFFQNIFEIDHSIYNKIYSDFFNRHQIR